MPFLRLYADEKLQEQRELTASVTIGRAPDNDLVLPSPSVSKYHAAVEAAGHGFVLVDKGSSNGVFVNGQRVTRHTLVFRDEIRIHPYRLLFMPLAKLPGEEDGREAAVDEQAQHQATQLFKAGDIAALMEQMKQEQAGGKPAGPASKADGGLAWLVRSASGERHPLDRLLFTLGRGADRDLRCGGWFAPRLAATIQRHGRLHYLIPAPRSRVTLNGGRIHDSTCLADGDRLEIQGLALEYRQSAET